MKAILAGVLVAGVLATGASSPSGQPDGDAAAPMIVEASRTLSRALEAGDRTRIAALLDDEFAWIDRDGAVHTRNQLLASTRPAGAEGAVRDERARTYGAIAVETATRTSTAGAVKRLRVFIKRAGAWRAIVQQENAVATAAGGAAAPVPAPGRCENPCRTLPYKPASAAERDILAAYQDLETAVATHDAERWAPHFADEFVVVGREGQTTSKPERVAAIRKQKATNAMSNPGPLRSMRIWVIGDAAVMTADHVTPTVPPSPYRVSRVWVKRDGRWQMAFSQQTSVVAPRTGTR